jgi:hypothetical protein
MYRGRSLPRDRSNERVANAAIREQSAVCVGFGKLTRVLAPRGRAPEGLQLVALGLLRSSIRERWIGIQTVPGIRRADSIVVPTYEQKSLKLPKSGYVAAIFSLTQRSFGASGQSENDPERAVPSCNDQAASSIREFPALKRRHCGASRGASNFGLKFADRLNSLWRRIDWFGGRVWLLEWEYWSMTHPLHQLS